MTYQDHPHVGKRVVLRYTSDPYTNLTSGAQGTITFVDDTGTVHVKWDNGTRLGLIPGEDKWEMLNYTS